MILNKKTKKVKIDESKLRLSHTEKNEDFIGFYFCSYKDKDGDTCEPFAEFYTDTWHCVLMYEDKALSWDMSDNLKVHLILEANI